MHEPTTSHDMRIADLKRRIRFNLRESRRLLVEDNRLVCQRCRCQWTPRAVIVRRCPVCGSREWGSNAQETIQ